MSDGYVEGGMVQTPWGHASELRSRRMRPGDRTPRGEVLRNQRDRLYGAVVAVVAEKGYEASTVADVLELSGVSRSDFYRHFANKAECLTGAAEALLELTVGALERAATRSKKDPARAIFETFIGLVCSQPAAARVWFVDLQATGERGEAVADHGFEALAEIVAQAAAEPAAGERGTWLERVLAGGLAKLIQTRVVREQQPELLGMAADLWSWLGSVAPPPRALEAPRRQRPPAAARFEGYTPGERIARAVAAVVADKGYGAMRTDDIAARAAISLSTFYENFDDKRDAVLAALEMSGAQIMALAGPAARRADDWQLGVRALYEAICAYFSAEPAMAELALVGVYGAGPRALARRDRVIDSLTAMLAPGFEENPAAPAVSAEAAGAAVYALMREQLRSGGPGSLAATVPLATYVTLVGFVGPERACAVANNEGRRR